LRHRKGCRPSGGLSLKPTRMSTDIWSLLLWHDRQREEMMPKKERLDKMPSSSSAGDIQGCLPRRNRVDLLEVQQFYHLIDDTNCVVGIQKIVRLDRSANCLTLIGVLENRHPPPRPAYHEGRTRSMKYPRYSRFAGSGQRAMLRDSLN
jgi:hypothetical protein